MCKTYAVSQFAYYPPWKVFEIRISESQIEVCWNVDSKDMVYFFQLQSEVQIRAHSDS